VLAVCGAADCGYDFAPLMRFILNALTIVFVMMLMASVAPLARVARAVPPVPDSPEPTTKAAKAQATSQPAILNPTYPPDFPEAERSIKRFKPASGMKITVFAAEPQLQNPVSLHIDDQNRFWVCETFRFDGGGEGDGVYDIRHRYHLLDDDLASKTVEQRLGVINKWNDNDLSKLTVYPDRLKLIEDKNNDNKADTSRIIAAWQKPLDGLASGAITRPGSDNEVYVTNIPDLILLTDKDKDGKYDQQTLSTGYGVRYSLLGHDLHGLRWGPDGRLYFSIGDRGMHVKTKEGKLLDYPDEGAVMRCDPDGSNLEIFATGLRNPQKLAFDKYGNLFTGDNNCDHGDPARWVYICEGGDTGWRIGYQHIMTPRATGPWKQENIYAVPDENTVAHVIPPIAHLGGGGPSGITYYPGTSMPAKYENHFFLTDFRAGPTSSVMSFAMKPKGAGFELVDKEPFVTGIVPTDVEFGPQGGAYITDWIGGFPKTEKGRIYRVTSPDDQKEAIVADVAQILKGGMSVRKPAELVVLLGHVDMRVRQNAQFELADRKLAPPDISLLSETAKKNEIQMARIHAIRTLGQIARKDQKVLPPLLPLLEDSDDEVRVAAMKVLGEAKVVGAYDQLVRMISDKNARVAYFAALNAGRYQRADAIAPMLSLLAKNDNKDKFLRHGAVMGMTYIGDRSALIAAAKHESPAARMGVLLAMRRLQMPEIADFLDDSDVAIVVEAARGINDTWLEEARPALASMLLKPRPSTRPASTAPAEKWPEALVHRALNANFRLGGADNAKAVATFAAMNDADEVMRIEALAMLAEWDAPRGIDRVVGTWHPVPKRDAAIAKNASAPVIGPIIKSSPDTVRIAAIDLLKKTGTENKELLYGVVTSKEMSPDVAAAALGAMDALNDARLADAVDQGIREGKGALRSKAIEFLSRRPDAVAQLDKILTQGNVADQQAVLTALGKIESQASDAILATWMDRLLKNQVAPEVKLDLLEAANESKSEVIRNKVKEYSDRRPKSDTLAAFRDATVGGDATLGRKIFFERADVSCVRCHKIAGEGGVAGPDLSGVAVQKDRNYLLESILDPNREIAPGFEAVTVKVKAGTNYTGVVKADSDTTVVIDAGDGAVVHIDKKQVDTRTKGLSPMPQDISKPLSKRDVRNLVEFLSTLKQPATQPAPTPQQARGQ
jgi:quinoprotein glucose dehydrogenase